VLDARPRGMGIAGGHAEVAMPEKISDRGEVRAPGDEPGGVSVPTIPGPE